MSDARTSTLAAIRRAIAGADDEARRAAVAARLASHPRNLIPRRGEGDREHRIGLFAKMAEDLAATTARVERTADIPAAIASYLRQHNLPSRLRHGADPLLAALDWSKDAPQIAIAHGPAEPGDEVSLSHAFAGVAETGTLILLSGADNPTTLNFLPETHIVLLTADRISPHYEAVWDRVRSEYGAGQMPRTVNMITGPSRTADVEQTIELGAHGPKRLHIIIVTGS